MAELIVFNQKSNFKNRLEFWQDRGVIAEAKMKVKMEGPCDYAKDKSFYLVNFSNRTITSDMALEELDRMGYEPLPMAEFFDLTDTDLRSRTGHYLVNLGKDDKLIDADGRRQVLVLEADKTAPATIAWTNNWNNEWFVCRQKKTCFVSDQITDLNVVFSD
jgi:hypothetical protein